MKFIDLLEKYSWNHHEALENTTGMIKQVFSSFTNLDAGFSSEPVSDNVKDKATFKLGWSILFSTFTLFFCLISWVFLAALVGIDYALKYLRVGFRYVIGITSVIVNAVLMVPVLLFVGAAFHPRTGRRRKYTNLLIKKS